MENGTCGRADRVCYVDPFRIYRPCRVRYDEELGQYEFKRPAQPEFQPDQPFYAQYPVINTDAKRHSNARSRHADPNSIQNAGPDADALGTGTLSGDDAAQIHTRSIYDLLLR